MKRNLLSTKLLVSFLLSLFVVFTVNAQTTIFNEDFEGATHQMVSIGVPTWAANTNLYVSGVKSIHNEIALDDSSFLITPTINLTGYTYVLFDFQHICKIEFFDSAEIFISIDNGASWQKIPASMYMGTGQYGSQGDKFNANSYATTWLPANGFAVPDNTWWKNEKFNVSSIAANQSQVKFRFKLADGTTSPGPNGNAGWFIDDVKVLAAPYELIPPTITMVTPILMDTVFSPGPFEIKADITDASGINNAKVFYTVGTNPLDSVLMSVVSGNVYMGLIPAVGYNQDITYYVRAQDNTPGLNTTTAQSYSIHTKKPPALVEIGTNTVESGTFNASPVNNYYRSRRLQILYTATELNLAGGVQGIINSIAFNVSQVPTHALPNYQVRMANVSVANLAAHNTTPSTLVKTMATYTPTLGWDELMFDQSFTWDGTSNLLIDICWDQIPAFVSTGQVWNYGTMTNHYRHVQLDASSQCGVNTTTTLTGKPNIKIGFSLPTTNNDAGVVAIAEPSGIVLTTGPQDVKVRIKNFGQLLLTSATINWSVNGVLQTPFAWTGSMMEDVISQPITVGQATFNLANNTIKAWTSMPNGILDENLANDTTTSIVFGCAGILNGNYTINSALPSGGTNFQTLTEAVSALTSCGISGPVHFDLAPGNYYGRIYLEDIPNSSAVNTITFKGTAGTNLTYTPAGTSDRSVIALVGAKYLRFDSLSVVVPDSATFGQGFFIGNNSEDIKISNCFIKVKATETSSNYNGIIVSGLETSATTASLNIKNIVIENNTIIGGYYGVTLIGATASRLTGAELVGNTITNSYYYGVYSNNTTAPKYISNTFNIRSANGTTFSSGIYHLNSDGQFEISKNRIINPGQYGVYISGSNSTPGNASLITNNAIGGGFRNLTSTLTNGIYITTSSLIDIYYNTVNMDIGVGRAINTTTSALNLNVINNSFSYTGTGTGYAVYHAGTASISSHDYNHYYSSGTNFVYYGTAKATLADLIATDLPAGNDVNSVYGNPVFNSPVILTPMSPVLNNVATPMASITTDILGNLRDATNPDMGAYEYTPVNADLALLDVKISNGKCLSNNDTIFVTINNAIGDTLFFAQNPLTVNWSVTGPVNSTGSFVINTDTLLPAASKTFHGLNVDLSLAGTYVVSAHILPNFTNNSAVNDTLNNHFTLNVQGYLFNATPDQITIVNSVTPVDITVNSNMFPGGGFFMTEICHYRGATTGAPAGGWPAYLIADDYVEITGVPNSDLAGYTFEQWTGAAIVSTFTFPSGTVLSPNGTAILAVGQLTGSVPSPANYYYHATGAYTGTFGSGGAAGRILKAPNGDIVDAVASNGYVFPASSGVTAQDWSGNIPLCSSTAGTRLVGPYTKTSANWVVSSASATQNPNAINTGVIPPTPGTLSGFTWSLDGVVLSHNNIDTTVGPWTNNGMYNYVATYTNDCGTFTDTVKVNVNIPLADLLVQSITEPITDICYLGNEDVTVVLGNIGSAPVVGGFNAYYSVSNGTPVMEAVNITVPAGGNASFTFATPINFTMLNDSIFNLKVWVSHPIDLNQTNDTIVRTFKFKYVPPAPIGFNDSVNYANTATVTAQTNAILLTWYDSPFATTPIHVGPSYTTPILYATTPYYVAASNLQSGMNLQLGTGTLASIYAPTYGWFDYSWSYVLYNQNELNFDGLIDTLGYFVNNNPTSYVMLNQKIYMANVPYTQFADNSHMGSTGMTLVFDGNVTWNGSGLHKFPLQTPFNYDGTSSLLIYWENLDGGYLSGYPEFVGSTVPSNMVKYQYADITFPTGTGSFTTTRPNTVFVHQMSGCESDRTEVMAVILNPPPVDAGIVSIDEPISPVNFQPQTVKVTLRSFGVDTLTTATINWTINGVPQTPYSWTGSLATGEIESNITIGTATFTLGNSNIAAWPTNPNGVVDPTPSNDTAFLSIQAFEPLCGTYNIGGPAAHFTNFSEAVSAMVGYSITCPVTFVVEPGIYTDSIIIPNIAGASATNTITFKPGVGGSVTLVSTSPTATVKFDGAKHIIFDGSANGTNSRDMIIQNNSTGMNNAAIWMAGTATTFNDSLTIKNCIVIGSSSTTTSSFGIHLGGASITTSGTGRNNNITLHNNQVEKAYYGIYARGIATTGMLTNLKVTGNTIGSNTLADYVLFKGVDVQNANAPLIEGNNIFNLKATTSINNAGIELGGTVNDAMISKNRISGIHSTSTGGWGAYGINIASTTVTSATIVNNMISDILTMNYSLTSTFYNAFGIRIVGGTNHKVYYNSVNLFGPVTVGSSNGMSAAFCVTSNTATGLDVRNNVFANSQEFANAASRAYAIYAVTGTVFATIDHNDYYSTGTNEMLGFFGSDVSTLTAWRTATTKDVNSISAYPMFQSPTDLHSWSYALNAAATPIASVIDDIDGELRDLVTPDIGADEFTPSSIDAGLLTINSPTGIYQEGDIESVIVTIRNYGIDTLYSVPVFYQHNNNPVVTQTWTGVLDPNTNAQFTLPNLTVESGINNLVVWVDVSGDLIQFNDTLDVNFWGLPGLILFQDDFEGTSSFTTPGTVWQHGIPAGTVIHNAASGTHAWVTNLTGNYPDMANAGLVSPTFNFTGINDAYLSFSYFMHAEVNNDGGTIQYSTDNGINWAPLGVINDPDGFNWYDSFVQALPGWSHNTNGWKGAFIKLSAVNNAGGGVKFRVLFRSNAAVENEGMGFDNVKIHVPLLATDAGITEIVAPSGTSATGSPNQVTVKIRNNGTQTLTSIPVSFRPGTQPAINGTWTGTLLPGDETTYTFTSTFIGPNNPFTLCAYTSLSGDVYRFNDTTCVALTPGLPTIDAGVTEIIAPLDNPVVGDQVTVTVKVKNFGTQTLNTIPVQFSLNGVTQATEMITTPLLDGDSTTYSFVTKLTVPSTDFQLCAKTAVPSDAISTNDQTCVVRVPDSVYESEHKGLILMQNIPNPATESTVIGFSLPSSGKVYFRVTSVLGEVLYQESKNYDQGFNSIEIDTRNLAAGIYYYSITFDQTTLTRKLSKQ